MDKASRGLKILELIQKNGQVEVTELAKIFNTSEMTIRRDLNALSKTYNVTRTHGGASIPQNGAPIIKAETFVEEKILNKEKKDLIAKKAASLIEPRQRIFIDPGSTARLVTKYLQNEKKNIVVTNSVAVVDSCLQYDGISVILLGGMILPGSRCVMGTTAEEQLRTCSLDAAFIGASAVGNDGKAYDGYSPEAWFKKMIFDVAEKVYLLVDSTKFNTYDLTAYAHLQQFAGIITDRGIDEKTKAILKKRNLNLIIADKKQNAFERT